MNEHGQYKFNDITKLFKAFNFVDLAGVLTNGFKNSD